MRTLLWVVIICFIGVYFSSRKNRKAPNHSPSNTAQTLARHGIGKRRQSRKLLVIEKPNIDLSDEITKVLEILENTNTNIFLTGRAGTGKSTLLRYFRATTKKNIVVLAPTGVAAVNVQGETIHHFFKFYPGVTEDKVSRRFGEEAKIYKKVDVIVIDEVSMVRADLFDCVDKFLRLNGPDSNRPFGGIQIVAIGDLYQLPPVVGNNEKDIFESHYPSKIG